MVTVSGGSENVNVSAQTQYGPAGRMAIGEVTTLPEGSPATVENVGTPGEALLNIGIPKGNTGDVGKSVYQIWLELGFTGTEADFIASLKGEKGDAGDLYWS